MVCRYAGCNLDTSKKSSLATGVVTTTNNQISLLYKMRICNENENIAMLQNLFNFFRKADTLLVQQHISKVCVDLTSEYTCEAVKSDANGTNNNDSDNHSNSNNSNNHDNNGTVGHRGKLVQVCHFKSALACCLLSWLICSGVQPQGSLSQVCNQHISNGALRICGPCICAV